MKLDLADIRRKLSIGADIGHETLKEAFMQATAKLELPRGGAVLRAVSGLFRNRTHWTPDQIRVSLSHHRIGHTRKEVANALAYLVRRGRIQRLRYGHYRRAA